MWVYVGVNYHIEGCRVLSLLGPGGVPKPWTLNPKPKTSFRNKSFHGTNDEFCRASESVLAESNSVAADVFLLINYSPFHNFRMAKQHISTKQP